MLVAGRGPQDAKVVIVGEAPGAEEERVGIPFVGPSGRLLDDMLSRNGIARDECYVTNIMRKRPPGNDFGSFYEDRKRAYPKPELTKAVRRLHLEIQRIRPNVVLALGGEALRCLTSKHGITKWRGSILETKAGVNWPGAQAGIGLKEIEDECGDWRPVKVIGTFHPAMILRQYSNRAIAELDIRRVGKERVGSELNLPSHEFILRPSHDQVMDWLARSREKLAFDIETVGRRVRCIALSDDPRSAICIPFMTLSHYGLKPGDTQLFINLAGQEHEYGSYWSESEEYQVLRMLSKVLGDRDIGKVAQNFPFDSTLLAREFGFCVRGLHIDTLAAHHVLWPELPKSLDFLCSVYTRVPRYSDHNASIDEDEWTYNCYDAAVDLEVAVAIEKDLHERGLWEFYKSHVERTMIAVTRAQNRYLRIDVPLRDRLRVEGGLELERLKGVLNKVAGIELNPNSPKQVKEYLQERGVRVPINRKTKAETTGEKQLVQLKDRYPAQAKVIGSIRACRGQQKLLSTFLGAEMIDADHLETTYNVSGTVTGRLSSSQTLWKTGVNVQQTPKSDVRRIIIARPGMTFIKTDLSQAEARVVYWDGGMRDLVERYLDDPFFDIHTWNGVNNVFHVPTLTGDQRDISKAGVHGGNYGLGYKKASEIYGITTADAKLSINGYRSGVPQLREWWDEIEERVTATRTLHTVLGRERVFMGRLDHELFRSAYAFKPQSTVVDVINRVFFTTDRNLKHGWPLIQAHDEIVFEVDEEKVGESLGVIREAYRVELKFEATPEPLLIPVDISIGKNWWDQEKVE